MCGIAGSLNWNQPDPPQLIEAMTRQLSHRGPDAERIVPLGPLVLGHRRLSIIDISSNADQPMRDHSQRYWITYNGELYNYKVLKKELLSAGHQFQTHSDTEVILEAWKRWGPRCLEFFIGMFAFALWDSKEQSLFLARDRLGEKPLYYSLQKTYPDMGIIFASEIKALQPHPAISQKISNKAISQFISLNYILSDACVLEGVEKLAPAHYLFLKKGQSPILKRYWDLAQHYQNKPNWRSKEEAIEQLQGLIQESVQQQLISDVPLGAFLSGGIDSSTIVAEMAQQHPASNIKTFSIGFKEKSYNELAESSNVASYLGVSHHTQVIDAGDNDIAKIIPSIFQKADEPFADSSMIPTYFLAQFSRQTVKVCLSGDGGDELFAGYETYAADKLYQIARYLPKRVSSLLSQTAEKLIASSHDKVSMDYKLKQFLKGCTFDFSKAHYSWRTIFSDQEKERILNQNSKADILQHDPFQQFLQFFNELPNAHYLDQASYVDIKTWLVDDILVKVDRLSMAHSLEARAPFLDHRLVEFAAGLPVDWKMKFFQKKRLLKLSQKARLPKIILYRSKKGFNAPIAHWLAKPLQTLGREVTLDNQRLLSQWLDISSIEQLWQEHSIGLKDHSLKLFGLMSLSLWLENQRNSSHPLPPTPHIL